MIKVLGKGRMHSKIMLVTDFPTLQEELAGEFFPTSGSTAGSGWAIRKLLQEAGIDFDDCYVTSVCKYHAPIDWVTDKKMNAKRDGFVAFGDRWVHPLVVQGALELDKEVEIYQPECVVGLGNLPLLWGAGKWGITQWRGSELILEKSKVPFVPTLHPSSLAKTYSNRPLVLQDLRQRVVRRLNEGFKLPRFTFNTRPTLQEAVQFIDGLRGDVAGDIETSLETTVCLGLADSGTNAICLPVRDEDGPYWSYDAWSEIMRALRRLRERPDTCWIGQNWNYDAQYLEADFNLVIRPDFDTYIAQSVLFPGVSRGLDFLASMYCDWFVYWKDDGKDWKNIKDFNKEFRYNCRDTTATWEVKQAQAKLLRAGNLEKQFQERMRYGEHVYRMMVRGVNRCAKRVRAMTKELDAVVSSNLRLIEEKAGKPINFSSPKQVGELFYKQWGVVGKVKRGKTGPSTDDEALKDIAVKRPDLRDAVEAILESRSLSSLRANFLMAESEPNGRFVSSWMATGAETFRLTSSKNAFHRGGPLQNVTDGKHTASGRKLPNLRSCIVPDEGYMLFNCDLERADLQVVAWEADDRALMLQLENHDDVHSQNAKDIFNLVSVTEQQRHFGKKFVHLTNYGGQANTCAKGVGCTVKEAERLQKRWFEMHPGILGWHRRTQAFLLATRTVKNRFGYRRIYFDRVDMLLPEALAWLPQSTVSILISLQQMAIENLLPDVQMLMQGHDSIVGQYPTERGDSILLKMREASRIAVPYERPLYIPLELATSSDSWGNVVKREWPTGE